MRRTLGLTVAAVAIVTLVSACARPTAPDPAPDDSQQTQPVAAWPDWAFPRSAVDIAYRFDDGTPETDEQLVTLGDRVLAVKEERVYVTWFVRPDGVYRRDPLGGKDAPLLRYLPAEPKHDMVWSQTSGDAQVWFRLQKAEECGRGEKGGELPGPCWDLYILNRGEVHFFRFARGVGITQAGALSPEKPAATYRKSARSQPGPAEIPAADVNRLAAAAGVWSDDKVAPYKAGTVAEFDKHLPDLSGFGKRMGSSRVFASWGAWTAQGLLDVETPYAWRWRPCVGKTCRLTWVPGVVPLALVETRYEGKPESTIIAYVTGKAGSLEYLRGFEPKLESTTGEVQAVSEGQMTIRRVLGDPAGHTETRVFQIVLGKGLELFSTVLAPTAGALKYPDNPRDVLLAAFVAKYYGQNEELTRYFSAPETAAAFSRQKLSPSPYGYRGMNALSLGKLAPYTEKSGAGNPPAVKLTPAPLGADGRTGFLLMIAYYEGGPEIWGQVRFVQEQGMWKIAELTIEGDQFVY